MCRQTTRWSIAVVAIWCAPLLLCTLKWCLQGLLSFAADLLAADLLALGNPAASLLYSSYVFLSPPLGPAVDVAGLLLRLAFVLYSNTRQQTKSHLWTASLSATKRLRFCDATECLRGELLSLKTNVERLCRSVRNRHQNTSTAADAHPDATPSSKQEEDPAAAAATAAMVLQLEEEDEGKGDTSTAATEDATGTLHGEDLKLEVQVQSQFRLLWAVFQSHSTAEDEVIWPALKEKARSSGGKVREVLCLSLDVDSFVGWGCLPAAVASAAGGIFLFSRLVPVSLGVYISTV